VEAVRRFQVEALYAGHCTGERAAARLARDLPGVAQPLGSGRTITFG
jgi:metal-dependent hydrolase (beta-lactamase superfamily II)